MKFDANKHMECMHFGRQRRLCLPGSQAADESAAFRQFTSRVRVAEQEKIAVFGDTHGCADTFDMLLYRVRLSTLSFYGQPEPFMVFLGDIADRGPAEGNRGMLRVVTDIVSRGRGLWVLGNHDSKLLRYARFLERVEAGEADFDKCPLTIGHGFGQTLDEFFARDRRFLRVPGALDGVPEDEATAIELARCDFWRIIKTLRDSFYVTHFAFVTDGTSDMFLSHAGVLHEQGLFGEVKAATREKQQAILSNMALGWVPADMVDEHGWFKGKELSRLFYGATTGRTTSRGFPERLDWAVAADRAEGVGQHSYQVHGHVACYDGAPDAPLFNGAPWTFEAWSRNPWRNRVLNLDTGACFGGHLSALVLPDGRILSTPSKHNFDAPTEND